MSDPRSLPRKSHLLRHILLVTVIGGAVLSFGVVSGFAADKSVEATGNSLSSYAWTPTTAEVAPGGTVEFKNMTGIPHLVAFQSPPAVPSCPGVPATASGNWSGTCTFTQAGTYNFYCTVHPSLMTGTITVSGPAAPVVTTEPATAVNQTGASLNGKVNPSGQATTYFFKYGTSTTYDHETTPDTAGSGTTPLSKLAAISGLAAETTYHFQIVAENASGTVAGADRTFTTAGKPTATTSAAASVGSIEATLKGTVNPRGLATEYFFNYGTTIGYGQETAKKSVAAGSADTAASQLVSGLTPETAYHFQLVAKNSAGEVKGADQSFTTTAGPLATTGPATAVAETSATLEGAVNPQGETTTYFFNYGTTIAYGQQTAEKPAGKGTAGVGVSEQVAGLSPGTTYHFQLVAKAGSRANTGVDQTFTTASTPPPPPPPPAPGPLAPPPLAGSAPETKITLKPPAKTRDQTPTIKFSATGGKATFLCSVDSKPFKACRSPFTTPTLKPGSHKIRVKAVVGGIADPTPASCAFKVLAAKK